MRNLVCECFFVLPTNPAEAETTINQKIMLKFYYPNESDVPDNLKGAYEAKNGRYELIRLDDDVPVVAHNKTLVTEKNTVETELNTLKANFGNLERERDEAKTKSLPAGHRAVPIEIADLGNAAKIAGFSKDELPTVKEKIQSFEAKEVEAAERTSKTRAFEFAEVKNPNAAFSLKATDDLKIEWKTVDGVEKPYRVTEKDGAKAETLFDKKFVEAADGFKEFAGELFAENGKRYVGQESGAGGEKQSIARVHAQRRYGYLTAEKQV